MGYYQNNKQQLLLLVIVIITTMEYLKSQYPKSFQNFQDPPASARNCYEILRAIFQPLYLNFFIAVVIRPTVLLFLVPQPSAMGGNL